MVQCPCVWCLLENYTEKAVTLKKLSYEYIPKIAYDQIMLNVIDIIVNCKFCKPWCSLCIDFCRKIIINCHSWTKTTLCHVYFLLCQPALFYLHFTESPITGKLTTKYIVIYTYKKWVVRRYVHITFSSAQGSVTVLAHYINLYQIITRARVIMLIKNLYFQLHKLVLSYLHLTCSRMWKFALQNDLFPAVSGNITSRLSQWRLRCCHLFTCSKSLYHWNQGPVSI